MRSMGPPERSFEVGPLLAKSSESSWLHRFPVLNTTTGSEYLPVAVLRNLRAAITVALVSVSLSIALGIASGTSPGAGLATAIWGGAAGGVLGSSQFNIIGPAGALSGLLNGYAHRWGPEILPWISLCSAGLVFLIQLLGLHPYLLFMPSAVFEGFTVAVAIIIGLGQLNNGLGLVPAHTHPEFLDNFIESMKVLDTAQEASYALFLSEVVVMYMLCRYVPKIPWMTVLPLSTILLGYFSERMNWALPTLQVKYGTLSAKDVFRVPNPDGWNLQVDDIVPFAVAVGSVSLIAVLETLISAKIAEARTGRTGLSFDSRRETKALAVGHLACGLFGAIPCTGVFVPTSINIDLGATHRIAQFMNAAFMVLVSAFVMPVFEHLPLPSIAAVLWVASIRMVPTANLRHLWHVDKVGFGICTLTCLVCVLLDPVIGLIVGMVISLLHNAMNTHNSLNCVERLQNTSTVVIRGPVTFINAHHITTTALDLAVSTCTMSAVYSSTFNLDAETTSLTLDLQHITGLDSDGATAIQSLVERLPETTMVRLTSEVVLSRRDFTKHMTLPWFERQRKFDSTVVH